ncbi:MAG: hypothetical protein EBY17_21320 [Acidobacteriia bacterium]|nr:hypothetical protein [Terriglobia bacterium]
MGAVVKAVWPPMMRDQGASRVSSPAPASAALAAPRPGFRSSWPWLMVMAAQGHGVFVGLPAVLIFGNALQKLMGFRHFVVELG